MGYLDHISNTIFTIEFENMNSLEQKAEVIRKPCEGLYTKRYRSHDFYVRSMDEYNYEINSNDKSTAIVNLLMRYLRSEVKIYNTMFDKLSHSSIPKITIHDNLNYNGKIEFVKNKLNGKATRKVQTNERFYTFSSVLPYMTKIGDKPNELISKHPK